MVVIVIVVVVVQVIAVDPGSLTLKFGQNRISNSWDIDDLELLVVVVVGGWWWWWCKVIFMSNPTFIMLG